MFSLKAYPAIMLEEGLYNRPALNFFFFGVGGSSSTSSSVCAFHRAEEKRENGSNVID